MAFCDPACGCGNFLVVAYRELRTIETDVIVALREKEGLTTASLDVSLDQKLRISQFHGFELNWWPAKIAETAMFLVDHQANRELARRVGDAPNRLPIKVTANIVHGNALQLDWQEEIPPVKGQTYIFGNPPFIGQYTKTEEQTADMRAVWGKDYDGYLDYVTGWHAKTMQLLASRRGEFAYVTTNSITQGQPVPGLFGPLIREGWRIKFAHRTFAWDSEAPGKAAVHCVIVGFTRDRGVKQRLWDYEHVNGPAHEITVRTGVNAYLVDGANLLVTKRSKPLSPVLLPVIYGSKPTDGGFLVPKAGTPLPESDPTAMKYVRRFVGAKELLQDTSRWCLWMKVENFDPADVSKSQFLKERIESVKTLRAESGKKATREAAHTPHLFTELRQPEVAYLCIPSHVSETRRYWTAQRFGEDVICGNANFLTPDPDGFQFSLISSSMFLAWQRAIGGRIKSDLRFANTLTWNTFPVPEVNDKTRAGIIKAGRGVLEVRAHHPERSLADQYNPLAMDPELVKAHDKLDRAVDVAFGAPRKLTTEEQRLEILFACYSALI
ncbi:DNA methyltransferase [Corynebacterium crudilactis]|uniref:DNA methyltransferase n=1 Tax=Corynebacterium crudilactis TaxID=1652495 RepID=UPI00316AD441